MYGLGFGTLDLALTFTTLWFRCLDGLRIVWMNQHPISRIFPAQRKDMAICSFMWSWSLMNAYSKRLRNCLWPWAKNVSLCLTRGMVAEGCYVCLLLCNIVLTNLLILIKCCDILAPFASLKKQAETLFWLICCERKTLFWLKKS